MLEGPRRLRPLFPVACALALGPPAAAQVEPAFDLDHRTTSAPAQRTGDIVPFPGGGAVAATLAGATPDTNDVVLGVVRYSENGDRIWSFARTVHVCQYGNCLNGPSYDVDVDSAGNTYVLWFGANTQHRLMKLDPGGTTLFDQPIDTSSVPFPNAATLTTIAIDGQDRPFLVGSTIAGLLYPYLVTLGLDSDGQPRFATGGTIQFDLEGLAKGPNGRVLAYGAHDWAGFGQRYARFHELDAGTGAVRWSGAVSTAGYTVIGFGTTWSESIVDAAYGPGGDVAAFVNGAVSYAGNDYDGISLVRADANGGVRYYADLELPERAEGLRITLDGAGNTYLAGYHQLAGAASSDPVRLSVWKFDATGALEWQFRDSAGPAGASRATAAAVTDGGNLFVTGRYVDAGVGVDLLIDPAGTALWRAERTGESGEVRHSVFARDSIACTTDDQVWRQRQRGAAQNLARFVFGGEVGTPVCSPAVPNSTGAPATIAAIGTDVAAEGNLTLRLAGLPPHTFALALCSRTQGLVPQLGGGQGTLCLGGTIGRFDRPGEVRAVTVGGTSSLRVDTARVPQGGTAPPVLAGETWVFQAWYRDVNPGVTSNLTDAVSVVFL